MSFDKNILKLSTVTPFILNNKFIEDISLVSQFFQFGFLFKPISSELFQKYISFAIESKSLQLLTSLVGYLFKLPSAKASVLINQIDFENIELNLFFDKNIFSQFLALLGRRYKDSVPNTIIQKIECYKNINIKEELSSLVFVENHPYIVKLDPSFSFSNYFLEPQDFKAKKLSKVMKLLSKKIYIKPYDFILIAKNLINKDFQELSQKKKATLIIYLSTILQCFREIKKTNLINSILSLIINNIDILFSDLFSNPFGLNSNYVYTSAYYLIHQLILCNNKNIDITKLKNIIETFELNSKYLSLKYSYCIAYFNPEKYTNIIEPFVDIPSLLNSYYQTIAFIIKDKNLQIKNIDSFLSYFSKRIPNWFLTSSIIIQILNSIKPTNELKSILNKFLDYKNNPIYIQILFNFASKYKDLFFLLL